MVQSESNPSGMQVGLKAAYDCVRAFSETDFTDGLRASQGADAHCPRR
jgi:hypothetical protein